MKIKKEAYKKALNDEYWRGVIDGAEFAIKYPDIAKKYRGEELRAHVEAACAAVENITKKLAGIFNNTGR